MEFTITQEFPARLDRLWTAFGTRDYATRKYLALGATTVRIGRFQSSADAIEVELERDLPITGSVALPSWARKAIGRTQTLRHRTHWRRVDASHVAARLEITPVGLPVRAHGVGTIAESTGGSTHMVLNWRVDSMLGSKVERLFADRIRAALDDDHRFTLRYLAQAPSG
jgi:hypothetical protein